jgi:ferric-dicitrate binding protein FerR (iron transport regulator)
MIPEEGNSFRQARLMGGRALFDIRRDEANPFTIETPNATIAVLGTTFGVAVTKIETQVVLASGIVELASHADLEATVRLEPGERSRVLSLDLPSEPMIADVNAELSWTGDLFIRAESMADVAEQLSEVFDTRVEVDATLAGEMVSGTRFEREAGLEAALQELAMSLGAQVGPLEGGGFRIAP